MTDNPQPTVTVNVDVTNPGQFFACCGLLELADRLWPGAEGWYETNSREFCIACTGKLKDLLTAAQSVKYALLGNSDDEGREEDDTEEDAGEVQPLVIESPIELRLDWWKDKSIKTWAGSMKVDLIAAAMSNAIDPHGMDPFNQAQVVFDLPRVQAEGDKKKRAKPKKREPFYFDCRRATNSHSLDVGFSANDLKLTTLAYPVVEFLCLIGLQRSRPMPTSQPRVFEYWTWSWRCGVQLLPAAVTGLIGDPASKCLRFENGFRSGQKKHKAFRPAIPLNQGA